jgi:hypothetical protein
MLILETIVACVIIFFGCGGGVCCSSGDHSSRASGSTSPPRHQARPYLAFYEDESASPSERGGELGDDELSDDPPSYADVIASTSTDVLRH